MAAPGPPSGMVAIRRRVESRWSLRLPNPAFALVGKGWDEVLGALELPGSPAGKEARGEAPPQVVFSLSQHARVERQRTLLLNPPTPTTPTTQHNTDYKKKSSAARDHQRFGETTRPPTPGTRDKAHATSYMLHATCYMLHATRYTEHPPDDPIHHETHNLIIAHQVRAV